MIHLDTHVLAWLYAGETARLPRPVRGMIDREQLAISPMVELELAYLHEIGRVRAPATDVLDELTPRMELHTARSPFAAVVREAVGVTWTRDPFDRLIAGHAVSDDAVLLTADTTLLEHLPRARWS